jgi:hypothetical protein
MIGDEGGRHLNLFITISVVLAPNSASLCSVLRCSPAR